MERRSRLAWLAVFGIGAVFGALVAPVLGDLRDHLTSAKSLQCSPRTEICVGKPLRSIDINRAETELVFLGAQRGADRYHLSDLVQQVAKTERMVLRFERGKRITRVSIENGQVVGILEEPDVTLP